MCFQAALPLAGAAMSVAGTAMQNSADGKIAKKRNNLMASEQARQRAFSDQAFGSFDESHAALKRPIQDQALGDAKANRIAAIQGNISGDASVAPTAGSAPAIVKSEMARRLADAVVAGQDTARQLGALGGFGDLQFDNKRQLVKSGQNIALQGNLAQGSSGVLPYELNAANSAGAGRRQVGDILGALGSLGVAAGSSGMFSDFFAPPQTGLNSFTRQNAQALRGL